MPNRCIFLPGYKGRRYFNSTNGKLIGEYFMKRRK